MSNKNIKNNKKTNNENMDSTKKKNDQIPPDSRSFPPTPINNNNNNNNSNVSNVKLTKDQWSAVKAARNKFATHVSAVVKHQNAGNQLEISAINNFNKWLTDVNQQCIAASRVHPSHECFWGGIKEEAIKAGLTNIGKLFQTLRDHNELEEEKQFTSDVMNEPMAITSNDQAPNSLLNRLSTTIPTSFPENPLQLSGRTDRILNIT